MNNIKNVPEIRFKGCYDKDGNWIAFTHPWEQRKLGEIATFINGRAYSQDELLNSGKYKVLRVGNFYTNDFWYYSDMELDDKYYAENGDLLYTWSATFGPHIWHGNKVIYHYHIWKIELSKALEKNFALQLLERDKQAILSDKNGSTMVHITKAGMERKEVLLPKNIVEQVKIGQYFTNLDHLITLHQRKANAYERFKEGMVQKLLNQVLRFKADDGSNFPEWEEKKLGEVLEISTETNGNKYNKQDVLSVSDEYGVVNQIELQGRSFAGNDISKYKVVKTGQLVYTRSPLAVKPFGIIKRVGDEIGIVSPLYIVNDVRENNCSMFWYYNFDIPERTNDYLKPLVRMGAKHTMNISNEEWLSGKVMVPCLAEQQKIAKCLLSLDNVIENQKAKVAVLKKLKKCMLQKMIV